MARLNNASQPLDNPAVAGVEHAGNPRERVETRMKKRAEDFHQNQPLVSTRNKDEFVPTPNGGDARLSAPNVSRAAAAQRPALADRGADIPPTKTGETTFEKLLALKRRTMDQIIETRNAIDKIIELRKLMDRYY